MRFEWGEMVCVSSQNIRSEANWSVQSVWLPLHFLFHPPLLFPLCILYHSMVFPARVWRFSNLHSQSNMSEHVSNHGLHLCDNLAPMLGGVLSNHDRLSLCFLTCCCFDLECGRIYNSPFPRSFFFFMTWIVFLSTVDLPNSLKVKTFIPHPAWFTRTQEVNRLAFCWAAVASRWHWPQMPVRRACRKHKQGRLQHLKVHPVLSSCRLLLSVRFNLFWADLKCPSLQDGRVYCGSWQMENMSWSLQKTGIPQSGKPVMT